MQIMPRRTKTNSIRLVSERAGVSVATVSRVVNNRTDVSEKLRKKIQAVIDMNKLKNPSVSAFWTEGMIQFQKKTNEGLFNSAGNPTNEPVYSHQGRNTVLHFDGHVSSVRHAMVLCPHFYPPDRGCPVCRFYHPYL